jgi:hypothetical protein
MISRLLRSSRVRTLLSAARTPAIVAPVISSPSSRRRVVAAVVAVSLTALLAAPAIGSGGVDPPRRAFVGGDGLFARAKLGSYCVTYERDGTGVGVCADGAAPARPPRPRITVDPGDRIAMLFRHRPGLRDRPSHIRLALARIRHGERRAFSAHLKAHEVRGHARKWRARAPRQVARANLLTIVDRFPAGDATYYVGLRHP